MRNRLFVTAGVLLALTAIVYGWRFLGGHRRKRSPEELARLALESVDLQERELAAVELAQLGRPATEHLRRVLAEADSPRVRAPAIRGLAAQWDYDSMPALLDALDDPSLVVRGRAGVAVARMMSVDFDFRADAPAEQRQAIVKRFREQWEWMRDSAALKRWKKRLKEADG